MLLRWRTKIIDGEAHETETFENQEWQKLLISTFEAIPGLSGHALAQVIVDPEQSLHLIEINPRLGGASPLALAAGLNSIEWFLLQSDKRGKRNPREPKAEQKAQVKEGERRGYHIMIGFSFSTEKRTILVFQFYRRHNHCHSKSKGRSGGNHDHRKPGGCPRFLRSAYPDNRHGPSRQRHQLSWLGKESRSRHLRTLLSGSDLADRVISTRRKTYGSFLPSWIWRRQNLN